MVHSRTWKGCKHHTDQFPVVPEGKNTKGLRSRQEQTKKKGKCQNHSTQDSRVVPHRGTNWAALWLTSQIGRDAVLSESYGRGYCVHCVHTLYALPLWQHTAQINSLRTAHHSVPSPAEPALKRASAAHTTWLIQSDHGACTPVTPILFFFFPCFLHMHAPDCKFQ